MSAKIRVAGIVGGIVMVVAVGAWFGLSGPSGPAPLSVTSGTQVPAAAVAAMTTSGTPTASGPTTSAPTVVAPATSPTFGQPPPAPSTLQTPVDTSPQDIATTEFQSLVEAFTLSQDSVAYVAPSVNLPRMYPLPANTPILSTEKSKDGKWIIALTEDGQAAFLLTDHLGDKRLVQIARANGIAA